MRLKIKKEFSAIYLSVFILLYVSIDTILFGTNENGRVVSQGYFIIFTLSLLWIFKTFLYIRRINRKVLILYFGMMLVLVTTMLSTKDLSFKYLYEMCIITLAFCFCLNVDFGIFKEVYLKIMFFLSAFSVISFVIYEIAPTLTMLFPVVQNSTLYKFYFTGFSMEFANVAYISHRNFGIFREPGVFATFIILALVFELFMSEKHNLKRILVQVAALILTFSTAGYLILMAIVMSYLIFNNQTNPKKKMIVAVFSIIVLLTFARDTNIFESVFEKLFSNNQSKDSRLNSQFVNLYMLFQKPQYSFFGLGFDYVEKNYQIYASALFSSGTHNTNTILRMLSIHGLFYTGIFVSLLWNFSGIQKKIPKSILFLILYLVLSNESIMLNIIIYIIAFYAITNVRKNNENSID